MREKKIKIILHTINGNVLRQACSQTGGQCSQTISSEWEENNWHFGYRFHSCLNIFIDVVGGFCSWIVSLFTFCALLHLRTNTRTGDTRALGWCWHCWWFPRIDLISNRPIFLLLFFSLDGLGFSICLERHWYGRIGIPHRVLCDRFCRLVTIYKYGTMTMTTRDEKSFGNRIPCAQRHAKHSRNEQNLSNWCHVNYKFHIMLGFRFSSV